MNLKDGWNCFHFHHFSLIIIIRINCHFTIVYEVLLYFWSSSYIHMIYS